MSPSHSRMRPLLALLAAGALALPLAATASAGATSAPLAHSLAHSASSKPSLARALSAADRAAGLTFARTTRAQADALHRAGSKSGPDGLHYVRYERSYRGLPVVGADLIVTADETGVVHDTTASDALARASVAVPSVQPTVSRPAAERVASSRLTKVAKVGASKLVVLAQAAKQPRLAWSTHVEGLAKTGTSVQDVYVDARTGRVLQATEQVADAAAYGPSIYYAGYADFTVTYIGWWTYAMKSSIAPNLQCGGQNGAAYTNIRPMWGSGSGTDLVTACVDAMASAERTFGLLRTWAGRNGVDGQGNSYPIRVGLNETRNFFNGSYLSIGRNKAGTKQASAPDLIGHEYGHALFNTSGATATSWTAAGMAESTGDILGNSLEASNDIGITQYRLDPAIGERVDLLGTGPLRYMDDPSKLGHPNCVGDLTPATEAHAAAGPQNHWFYLVATGSHPMTTQYPKSPICPGGPSAVKGIGSNEALNIYVNALQRKTSDWDYAKARVATLQAAKTLYPKSCYQFSTVQAAWDAVGQPAVAGEPTCTGATNWFAVTLAKPSLSVLPGGSVASTLNIANLGGLERPSVALTASGLPTGATMTFAPSSVSLGNTSWFTITADATVAPGVYPVTVTATTYTTPVYTQSSTLMLTVGETAPTASPTPTPTPTVTASPTVSPTPAPTKLFENLDDHNIHDFWPVGGTVKSTYNANVTSVQVSVIVSHTCQQQLSITLKAPDGTEYPVLSPKNAPCTNIQSIVEQVVPVNENAAGDWTLRVYDTNWGHNGLLSSWWIRFP